MPNWDPYEWVEERHIDDWNIHNDHVDDYEDIEQEEYWAEESHMGEQLDPDTLPR